jgi:hypothetical protein
MGVAGLGAGLWVYYSRDTKPKDDSPPAGVREAKSTSQLEGLGYLPADTNIAFALQPGPFLAYAVRTNQDPGELLIRAGLPGKVLGTLSDLGLTLPQIDHLAGGTTIGNKEVVEFRLTLVLVLHRPLADEDDFLRRLKRKPIAGKQRYEVELAGLPMLLARVSPTVWVFGLALNNDLKENLKNLAAVEAGGYGPGGKQFPAELTEAIATRVPPDSAAWIATNAEHWAEKPAVIFVAELLKKKEWLPAVAQGRSALAALSFGEQPRVRLFVRATDETTGQRVRDYFKSKATDMSRHGGAGELAMFDTPIDPANAYAIVQQFLGDVKK